MKDINKNESGTHEGRLSSFIKVLLTKIELGRSVAHGDWVDAIHIIFAFPL